MMISLATEHEEGGSLDDQKEERSHRSESRPAQHCITHGIIFGIIMMMVIKYTQKQQCIDGNFDRSISMVNSEA